MMEYSKESLEYVELSEVGLNSYLNFVIDKCPLEYNINKPYYDVIVRYLELDESEFVLTKDMLYKLADIINKRYNYLLDLVLKGELPHILLNTCNCINCVIENRKNELKSIVSELNSEKMIVKDLLDLLNENDKIELESEYENMDYLLPFVYYVSNKNKIDLSDFYDGDILILLGDLKYLVLSELTNYIEILN